jgi:formate hydrogenlyase subunit 4
VSLFTVLFLPVGRAPAVGWLVYLVGSGALIAVITFVATATARLTVRHAFRFYWSWGACAAILALVLAGVR